MNGVLKVINIQKSIELKAFAIVLVLLGHLNIIPRGGAAGVSLFLFLSGYGLVCSYYKNGLHAYWKKRIDSVWIPYVLWTICAMVILGLFESKRVLEASGIEILFAVVGLNPASPIDATMWYIPYIFSCYTIFWLMYKSINNQRTRIIGVFFSCCIFGVLTLQVYPNDVGAVFYTLDFSIGVLIAEICSVEKLDKNYLKKSMPIFDLLITALTIFFYLVGFCHLRLLKFFAYAAFNTVFPLFAMSIFNRIKTNISILEVIGQSSYAIYLCEGIFLSLYFTINRNIMCDIVTCVVIICVGICLNKIFVNILKRNHKI